MFGVAQPDGIEVVMEPICVVGCGGGVACASLVAGVIGVGRDGGGGGRGVGGSSVVAGVVGIRSSGSGIG